MGRESREQTERDRERETERDRERERQRDRQTEAERDRQTEAERGRERGRERERQTDRQTEAERERQTDRGRERQRETERHRERDTERQRDRETERDREELRHPTGLELCRAAARVCSWQQAIRCIRWCSIDQLQLAWIGEGVVHPTGHRATPSCFARPSTPSPCHVIALHACIARVWGDMIGCSRHHWIGASPQEAFLPTPRQSVDHAFEPCSRGWPCAHAKVQPWKRLRAHRTVHYVGREHVLQSERQPPLLRIHTIVVHDGPCGRNIIARDECAFGAGQTMPWAASMRARRFLVCHTRGYMRAENDEATASIRCWG